MKSVFTNIKRSYTLISIVILYALTYAEPVKQDSARAVRALALVNFYSLNPDVRIEINPVTGVPEDIWGDISRYQNETDPVEAAYEFFEQNKDLYGIRQLKEELRLDGVVKDEIGTTVFLKQYYKGIEVQYGRVPVHFNRSGKLMGVNGGFAQIFDLSTKPSIDSLSAIRIVKRDLKYTAEDESRAAEAQKALGTNRLPVNAVLVIASYENCYHLVWIIDLFRSRPYESWVYSVDAHTGVILGKGSALLD